MKRHTICASVLAALMLGSCAAPVQGGDNSAESVVTSATTAAETTTTTAPVTTAASSAEADESPSASDAGYNFDLTTEFVELDGKFYECFVNRPIRFDGREIPYEEFLSYVSPYDEYITLFYDDHSGSFNICDTAAFAIRYACENDIECLDFPIEYDTATLYYAWEYARMSFPNLPLETLNSQLTVSDSGCYRIHFTKALRNIAGPTEPIRIAKEIVDGMPADCKTQSEKAYYLYDWVCKNVVYDSFHVSGKEGRVNAAPQAVYGALVDKRAVCDGIAGAIQLLYMTAGIECGKVDAFDYRGGAGHVWNVAEVGGEIWDFDATWDIHRFYDGKGDEITKEKGPGHYEWFGVERTAKTVQLDINDMMAEAAIFTAERYTADSPANLSYDIVVNTDPDNYEDTFYMNGKKVEKMDYDYIIDKTEKGELVSIKFNDSLALSEYWSFFTDSSSDLIDYKNFLGYPDTELLSIQIYPADYFEKDS